MAITPVITTKSMNFGLYHYPYDHAQRRHLSQHYTDARRMNQAMLGVALNEVFVPLLRKQFPEIIDFYLPPEGCSYRMAVVTIKNVTPSHAKRG